jgi:hypothetical protein
MVRVYGGCGCVIKRIKSVWLWDWSQCRSAIEAIHRQRPAEESKSASFGLGGCIGRGPWTALIGQALALALAELSASAYPDLAMSLWTARRSTRSVCLVSSIPMWQCPAVWQSGGVGWLAVVSVVCSLQDDMREKHVAIAGTRSTHETRDHVIRATACRYASSRLRRKWSFSTHMPSLDMPHRSRGGRISRRRVEIISV